MKITFFVYFKILFSAYSKDIQNFCFFSPEGYFHQLLELVVIFSESKQRTGFLTSVTCCNDIFSHIVVDLGTGGKR